MRAARTYFAGISATTALIAAAILVFVAVGSLVAFDTRLGLSGSSDSESVFVEPPEPPRTSRQAGNPVSGPSQQSTGRPSARPRDSAQVSASPDSGGSTPAAESETAPPGPAPEEPAASPSPATAPAPSPSSAGAEESSATSAASGSGGGPAATPPGHGGTPPGQGGVPPGLGAPPPGHGGLPPGQAKPPK